MIDTYKLENQRLKQELKELRKAIFQIEPMVMSWLCNGSSHKKVSLVLRDSLVDIADYLGIKTRI